MVRAMLLVFCLCVNVFAQSLEEKAGSFVSRSKFDSSSNLISYLFENEARYYKRDGGIDAIAVLKTLKDNALLDLSYKEPQDLELEFITRQNPVVFMRLITETLNSMGYNFFLTKNIKKTPEEFIWRISLSTQNVPSPILLDENLRERGCEITDVNRNVNLWSYTINSNNAKIDTIEVRKNGETELKKPFTPYLIGLSQDINMIVIRAHPADHWFPKVNFYDKNLRTLSVTDLDKRQHVLRLEAPQGATYVKIDDRYSLDNIKRGLSVTLE